ncbi:MAG: alpha-1,2-fucosyltransferase, partial [Bacteroidota bacterium]
EYYDKAIAYFQEEVDNPEIFVFSDDIEWCKENLQYKLPLTFVGHEYKGKRFGKYLYLMSLCKHFIIPNSTFGWWAAWLSRNEQKKVVMPKPWALHSDYFPPYIFTEGCVKMSWT